MNLEELLRKAADAVGMAQQIEVLEDQRDELTKANSTLLNAKAELEAAQAAIPAAKEEAKEIIAAANKQADSILFAANKNYDDRIEEAKKESRQIRIKYQNDVAELRKSMRGVEAEFDQRAENAGWPSGMTPETIKLVNETAFDTMEELIMRGVNDGR